MFPESPAKIPMTKVTDVSADKFWLKQSDLAAGIVGQNVTWSDSVSGATSSALSSNSPKYTFAFGQKWALCTASNSEGLKFLNSSMSVLNTALTAGEFTITVLCFGASVAASGTIIDKGKTSGCMWMLTQGSIGNAGSGRKVGRWDKLCSRSSALCAGKPMVWSYVRTTVGSIIQERLYVNGKLDYSVAAQSPPSNGTANLAVGGSSSGDYFFDGAIGEVQINGAALSYDQVRAKHTILMNQAGRTHAIAPPNAMNPLVIGWIGDSITDPTFNVTGAVYSLIASIAGSMVSSRLACTVTNSISSTAGTKTTDWLPDSVGGSGYFENADQAFESAGVQLVCIELGVNDAIVDNRTASAYGGQLRRIAQELVDRGKVVVIMPPTYASSDSTNLKTKEYLAVCQSLANGRNIFCADSQIWVLAKEQNSNNQLFSDGIHLLTGGQQFFAGYYADAIVEAVRTLGWFP
jgi:hypothetical protein